MSIWKRAESWKERPSSRWMSMRDRCDLAEAQLRMANESLGFITEGVVRSACKDWSDDGNGEQYKALKFTLMELVNK